MSEDSSQDKDLPASERKKQKAREEGDVPRSREFGGGFSMLVAMSVIFLMGPSLLASFQFLVRSSFTFDRQVAFDPSKMASIFVESLTSILFSLFPLILAVVAVSVLANLAVGGINWSTKAIEFKASKLNPIKGLKNIFSVNAVAELTKAIVKSIVIGGVGFYLVISDMGQYSTLAAMGLKAGILKLGEMVAVNMMILCSLYFLLTAADVPYQLWRYNKKLKMSFEELKKEHKESDGDPFIKAKIRAIQREMAKRRMMGSIPSADVVVTNPTHYAVAIKYEKDKGRTPVVVAKGTDDLAQRIRDLANDSGVPIVESPPLARSLYKHVEVNRAIPDTLFRAVAKVLAYVYSLKNNGESNVELPTENDIPPGMDPGVSPA